MFGVNRECDEGGRRRDAQPRVSYHDHEPTASGIWSDHSNDRLSAFERDADLRPLHP